MNNSAELASAVMDDIVAWLTANGIEPKQVSPTVVPRIANEQIVCDVYLINGNGRKYRDDATGKPAKGVVTVPLVVAPPPVLASWLASRREG